MSQRALLGALVGTILAAIPAAFSAQPEQSNVSSAAIQNFLIGARGRQCIATWRGPNPGVQPFTILEISRGKGPEYLVSARGACFCSPTGNCQFWVVIPSGTTFRVLLKAQAVQQFVVLQEISKGYPDLDLSMHGSAFETTHRQYRFDGVRYQRTK